MTITVDDGAGGKAATTFELFVNNVAPVIASVSAPVNPVQGETSVTLSASFVDPGTGDTHTATIDWGDGTISDGAAFNGVISGAHSYSLTGVYTVKVAVVDQDGGYAESFYSQYVVIYEQSTGFVTGGGWIDSPAGPYTPDPGLSGKATFGFTAKYKKGASIPDGNIEFQLKAANVVFKSTRYDQLVISGHMAKVKGAGTINGQGSYGFMLTATDGALRGDSIDRFRLKIWDKDNNDAVIYDNQINEEDTTEQAAALGGGSIVIHK